MNVIVCVPTESAVVVNVEKEPLPVSNDPSMLDCQLKLTIDPSVSSPTPVNIISWPTRYSESSGGLVIDAVGGILTARTVICVVSS